MEGLLCPWEASSYLFFSSNVPALVHYSHFVAVLAACVVALYVFSSDPRSPIARLFLFLVTTFSLWTILDSVLWATNRPEVVMLAWSLQILLEPMTYVAAFFLYYFFIFRRWPSFWTVLAITVLFLPVVLFLPTEYNLGELYLSDCEASEGPLAKYYTHFVHGTLILAIALLALFGIPRLRERRDRLVSVFFGFGLISFLLAFSSGTIIGSFTDVWEWSQYGLFGMPIFAAFIAYSIIRFKAFNAKVLTAELLVVALGVGVISLIALQDIQNVRIVAAITFVLVCIIGYILVRNVRKEVEQRELIERQEKELEIANRQQESLLHFISHEVKGYLTDGQNAFAAIIEGDLGAPPPKMREMSQQALVKMRQGVRTVMEILDASNLKLGTVSYKKQPFDFKSAVEEAVEHLRPRAAEKQLQLDLSIDATKKYSLVGDKEKITQHVVRNLIDNAIRYTPKGNIHVTLVRTDHAVRMSVKDTGVGITDEDKKRLFTQGGHGKESIKVNVDSTGYGLFVAKQVVEAHGGSIRAESAGAGKGSEFIVELPVT